MEVTYMNDGEWITRDIVIDDCGVDNCQYFTASQIAGYDRYIGAADSPHDALEDALSQAVEDYPGIDGIANRLPREWPEEDFYDEMGALNEDLYYHVVLYVAQ